MRRCSYSCQWILRKSWSLGTSGTFSTVVSVRVLQVSQVRRFVCHNTHVTQPQLERDSQFKLRTLTAKVVESYIVIN